MNELTKKLLLAEAALDEAVSEIKDGPDEQAEAVMEALALVRLALVGEVEAGRLKPEPRFSRIYVAVCLHPEKFMNKNGTPKKRQPAPKAVLAARKSV